MADDNVIAADSSVVSNEHCTFVDIYNYISNKRYPETMKDKGQKANFRRAVKPFCLKNGKLTYLKKAKDGSQTEVCKIFLFIKISFSIRSDGSVVALSSHSVKIIFDYQIQFQISFSSLCFISFSFNKLSAFKFVFTLS